MKLNKMIEQEKKEYKSDEEFYKLFYQVVSACIEVAQDNGDNHVSLNTIEATLKSTIEFKNS